MYYGNCGSNLPSIDVFCGNFGTKRIVEADNLNKDYENVLYSYHGTTIALLSKLAKIDGIVCQKEADYIKNLLNILVLILQRIDL